MKPEVEISPELKYNNQIAEATAHALNDGAHGLKALPGLLRIMLDPKKECWKKRYDPQLREVVPFNSFERYVTTDPPKGLGTDTETLKRLCPGEENTDVRDMIDEAVKKGSGNTTGKNQHLQSYTGNKRLNYSGTVDIVNGSTSAKSNSARPTGNSESAALRRLRKDRTDLHAQVIAGEMSANAAMIQAGFRRNPTTVEKVQKLWLKMTPEEKEQFQIWATEQLC